MKERYIAVNLVLLFFSGFILGAILVNHSLREKYELTLKQECVESKEIDVPEAILYSYSKEGNDEIIQPYIVPAHKKLICVKYK